MSPACLDTLLTLALNVGAAGIGGALIGSCVPIRWRS